VSAVETEERDAETEYARTTAPRSRILFPIIAAVLLGAIGLALVDMVGESNHEVAVVRGNVGFATTTARDFGYVPELVKVPPGVPLRLKIRNEGAHSHSFTIRALHVDVVIPARTSTWVTVRLPRKGGEYLFYCRFHQSLGMRGFIDVAP
jgi:plastocyanin